MKWPWRRCGDEDRADQAIRESEEQHREAVDRAEEVNEVVQAHRDLREQNHFAELFARALREGR